MLNGESMLPENIPGEKIWAALRGEVRIAATQNTSRRAKKIPDAVKRIAIPSHAKILIGSRVLEPAGVVVWKEK